MAAEVDDHIFTSDPALALDTRVREELGFDPKELGGSPWIAAVTSLVLVAPGAFVPLLPFLVGGAGEASRNCVDAAMREAHHAQINEWRIRRWVNCQASGTRSPLSREQAGGSGEASRLAWAKLAAPST